MRQFIHFKLRTVFGLALIPIFLLCHESVASTQERPNQIPSTDEVVDQASFPLKNKGLSSHVALAVDRDDNIKLYSWFERSDHAVSEFRVSEYLGRRISQSGSLSLSQLVPKHEIAALSFRVTSADQRIFHIVLSWGISREDAESPEPWYSLHVFEQLPGSHDGRQVYSEQNINLKLSYMQVRNLGGSGLTEIIDIGSEDRGEVATVRLLEKDGQVRLLQHVEGDQITLLGDRFSDSYVLRIENQWSAGKQLKAGNPCSQVRELKWSSDKIRFIESK